MGFESRQNWPLLFVNSGNPKQEITYGGTEQAILNKEIQC